MFGIRFTSAPPTVYVLHYKNGRVVREGPGLAFFYYAPTSTLVHVPIASVDLPFVFQEVTADFQQVTIQGQLTHRVAEPKRLAALLDFSVGSDGAELLAERLVHDAQIQTRTAMQGMDLRRALAGAEALVVAMLPAFRKSVEALGVEILNVSILSIKPTPEMSKALEAEAREALQRRADGAIYDRRNAAVEQERRIKENELSTEVAVEEKKRQIRETQMSAEIAVEQQREALLAKRTENDRKDADAKAYALEAALAPIRATDWKSLIAVNGADPRMMIALAFRELAENATKIGELNMSPELLGTLLQKK